MNLPNRLTIFRLILVPVFVILMSVDYLGTYIAAYIVFMVASITDYWDGRIARERNLITNFGKLMDPLADKVLMAAAFVMLMEVPVSASAKILKSILKAPAEIVNTLYGTGVRPAIPIAQASYLA